MAVVVGVKFKKTGKVYDFDAGDNELELHDQVVVETVGGLEMGQVAVVPRDVPAEELSNQLKPVVRKANEADIERAQELEHKEAEALAECDTLIAKLNLQMKPLSAEYSLDGNRLTIYFSAVERVDFRELVRELARLLKVRVEMRQTGPRDEARIVGGCGRCGRELCCASFLTDFAPVAMRMAKDQGLPLNPMKISGCCGRLMCCLVYENEQYREMKRILPKNGQMVYTAMGEAKVIGNNPIKETVLVAMEDQPPVELPFGEVSNEPIIPPKPVMPEKVIIPERQGPATSQAPVAKPGSSQKTESSGNQNAADKPRPFRRQRNRRRNPNPNNANTNNPATGNPNSSNPNPNATH